MSPIASLTELLCYYAAQNTKPSKFITNLVCKDNLVKIDWSWGIIYLRTALYLAPSVSIMSTVSR